MIDSHYWSGWMRNLGLMWHVKTETYVPLQSHHKFQRSYRTYKALQSIPRVSIRSPSAYARTFGREY